MLVIRSKSILSAEAVHGSCRGSDPFRAAVNKRCRIRVSASALLTADLTNATSTDSLYSLIVSVSVASCLRISISLDALVVSCALPVRAYDIQCWVRTGSMTLCSPVAPHWSIKLIPFRVASSLARFLCRTSFSGRSQQVSSVMGLLSSRATLMASKLASTQTVSSFPLTHQSPRTWSSCITLSIFSIVMHLRVTSCTSSFHPDITEVPRRFMAAAAATVSRPHTGKWLTSFPHKEKGPRRVITSRTSGTSLPRLHWGFSPSPLTCSPGTFISSWSGSGALHTNPKRSKCSLTLLDEATFSLT